VYTSTNIISDKVKEENMVRACSTLGRGGRHTESSCEIQEDLDLGCKVILNGF
jgi:hypothetical protein